MTGMRELCVCGQRPAKEKKRKAPPRNRRESADDGDDDDPLRTLSHLTFHPSPPTSHSFALPTPTTRLGLPTGRHITLKGEWEGAEVMRPYTPVTDDDVRGHVDFVVKVYPTGRVSRLLGSLKPGDAIWAKGPRGRFVYAPGAHSAVGMVAGGTGVTPMLQVAKALLKDPRAAATSVSLLFANVTEADILCKEELEGLVASHPGRFRVTYTLDEPGDGWTGEKGRVSKDMLAAALPPPGPGVLVCRCGPGPMNKAVAGLLEELGYDPDASFEF
jgi:cytochrome-b5 reductase